MHTTSTSGDQGQLVSLTYLSTAAHAFSQDSLEELLGTVRERNGATGLTGM